LYAPVGTPVLAVAPGKVTQGPYLFYGGCMALEIDHGTFTVRYGEILNEFVLNVTPGSSVRAEQVIGHVGQLHGMSVSMLHFELFTNAVAGPLTDFDDMPYKRRSDLIDPTKFLDECFIQQTEA
jgi:murein DD-endopeptidase MepM/ murein hydrolase activator NlpD